MHLWPHQQLSHTHHQLCLDGHHQLRAAHLWPPPQLSRARCRLCSDGHHHNLATPGAALTLMATTLPGWAPEDTAAACDSLPLWICAMLPLATGSSSKSENSCMTGVQGRAPELCTTMGHDPSTTDFSQCSAGGGHPHYVLAQWNACRSMPCSRYGLGQHTAHTWHTLPFPSNIWYAAVFPILLGVASRVAETVADTATASPFWLGDHRQALRHEHSC